jgi:hypothetical protein
MTVAQIPILSTSQKFPLPEESVSLTNPLQPA